MMRWAKLPGAVVAALPIALGMAQDTTTHPATAPAAVSESRWPPEIAADRTTPKGTLKLYYLATRAGDGEDLRSLVRAQTPQEREFVDARIDVMQAQRALAAAASVRFGVGMDQYLHLPTTMPADAASRFVDHILVQLAEEVSGDRAAIGNSQQSVKLVKVRGKWWISLETERLDKAEQFRREARACRAVAADVAVGKFGSPPEITTAMKAQLAPAATSPTTAP